MTAGIARDSSSRKTPPTISAPPSEDEPAHRDQEGQPRQRPTDDDGQHAADDPANDRRARRLREPALLDDVSLELPVEFGDRRTKLEELVRFDEAAFSLEAVQPIERVPFRGSHGPPAVARPLSLDDFVAGRWLELDADLSVESKQTDVLAEPDQPAAGQVEHRGGQGAA